MSDPPAIVCDMTGAADTPEQRVGEYAELFHDALVGRERTEEGIRFRFRAGPGLEDRVRDLARREQACCAFFSFAVVSRGDELWWDAAVVDDEIARQILDEFFRLPDTVAEGVEAVGRRFAGQGLRFEEKPPGDGLSPR